MFDLNLFVKHKIIPDWNDIYYGISNNYLHLKCVSEYAIMCLESFPQDETKLLELAWKSDDKEYLLETIKSISCIDNKMSEDKWKYCIVKDLVENCCDKDKLFLKLDELYASFNYPVDMEEFVSYMPVKDNYDPSQNTQDENMNRLLEKVEIFLEKKKNVLNLN